MVFPKEKEMAEGKHDAFSHFLNPPAAGRPPYVAARVRFGRQCSIFMPQPSNMYMMAKPYQRV